MRSDRDQCLFSSPLPLPYISTHIHNDSVAAQIKVLECFCVWFWTRLCPDVQGTSILDWNPFPESCGQTSEESASRLCNCRVAHGLYAFSFHNMIWERESVKNTNVNLFLRMSPHTSEKDPPEHSFGLNHRDKVVSHVRTHNLEPP